MEARRGANGNGARRTEALIAARALAARLEKERLAEEQRRLQLKNMEYEENRVRGVIILRESRVTNFILRIALEERPVSLKRSLETEHEKWFAEKTRGFDEDKIMEARREVRKLYGDDLDNPDRHLPKVTEEDKRIEDRLVVAQLLASRSGQVVNAGSGSASAALEDFTNNVRRMASSSEGPRSKTPYRR